MNTRCVLAGFFACILLSGSGAAASFPRAEHWSCDMGKYDHNQEWTIIGNRMFAPKGKGALPVIMNTPQVAAAYLDLGGRHPHDTVVVVFFILDKISGRMVIFNNNVEANLRGKYGKVSPDIKTVACRRLD